MNRYLTLLGPILSLLGTMGLLRFGGAFVRVMDVMTYRFTIPPEPPEPLPTALSELPWALMAVLLLIAGMILRVVSGVFVGAQFKASRLQLLFYGLAVLALGVGCLENIYGMWYIRSEFVRIAMSSAAPSAEEFELVTMRSESYLTQGCGMLILFAVFWLLAELFKLRSTPVEQVKRKRYLAIFFGCCCIGIGVILALVVPYLWLNGSTLRFLLLGDFSQTTASPKDLGEHLVGVIHKSMFLFPGLLLQGILLIAFLCTNLLQQGRAKAESESATSQAV